MAINIQIYSNANSSSKSISFEFVGDVLSPSTPPYESNVGATSYYFKATTNAKQDDNVAFPPRVVRGLSELVLAGQKQRIVNTANAYSDIRSMVVDYVADYIWGHDADLYSSGVTKQNPMQF